MIEVAQKNSIQVLRINRPEKKNALTEEMYLDMEDALASGDQNSAVRVHLILGNDVAFTSGNDLAEFKTYAESGDVGDGVVKFLHVLPKLQKPIVAAVDGLAIGVGTTMLFHCDMVLASPNARFKTPFLDLGLVPEAASTLLAPGAIGHARAFELLCLGQEFAAEDALRMGLINRIVESESLEQAATELCESIAKKPPDALRTARELMRSSTREEVAARIDAEVHAFEERLRSKEAMAAFNAFFNRK